MGETRIGRRENKEDEKEGEKWHKNRDHNISLLSFDAKTTKSRNQT